VTKEVIQMNQIENGNIEQLLEPNEEFSYLRSPAGVCTKIVVPASAIKEKIGDRIINGLNFSMKAMPQEEWLYAFEAPKNVLLLPEDSVQSFFENNKIEDNVTSYLATFGEYATNTYSFGNISSLLQVHLENKPDEDLNLILLPVLRGTQNSSSSWGSSGKPYTTSITNYMKPSGVRLKKDKEAMQIVVLTSKYND
jgi:flagellar assembly factor FliW